VSGLEQRSLGSDPQAHPPRPTFGRAVVAAAAGPCAWFLDLSSRFFLVEFGAARDHEGLVIVLGLFFCLVALGASLVSLRLWQRVRGQGGELEFVTALGLPLAVFSAIVIAAALVPHYYFDGAASP
jgi:hypothetical protein